MKILSGMISGILFLAILFFGGIGIYSGITGKAYKEVLTDIFKTESVQEVEAPTNENKIETETATIYFNI